MQLSKTQIIGLILGIIGFIVPFFIELSGLSYAGHLALSIFALAAFFWMFEPIPIYSTSMMVIFLEVLFLSAQGPMFDGAELPTAQPEKMGQTTWKVPKSAVTADNQLLLERGEDDAAKEGPNKLAVEVVERHNNTAIVSSSELEREDVIITQANHKLVGYSPNSYSDYLATLASPIIILFLGGFTLAGAAVKFNLDKNITRILLQPFGTRPLFIILGLMLVTAILSAFMSNTATTAMMMTVILPILSQVKENDPLRIGVALSIPVAANIGGIATPIGTPPNAVVIGALSQQGIDITFGSWMLLAVPLVIVSLAIAWLLLISFFPARTDEVKMAIKGSFLTDKKAIVMYFIFGLTVLFWVTESLHGVKSSIVALVPVVGFTLTGVLGKEDIRNLPWEVLWLVAGGISLGIALENTGLAYWIVNSINWSAFSSISLLIVFGAVCLGMANFLSHTVTATLIVPLGISLGISGAAGADFSIVITSLVIGVAASFGMSLPISTPPNAIAMSTGMLETKDMAKIGVVMGIIGLVFVILLSQVYWPFVV